MSETETSKPERLSPDSGPTTDNAAVDDDTPPRRFSIVAAIGWMFLYCLVLPPILLFLASLLGRYFLVCELICNFRAYILITLLVSGPALFLLKQKWLTAVWLGATLWAMMGTVSVFLPTSYSASSADHSVSPQTISVMSFNVLGSNRQHTEIIEEIKRHDPDVFVMLEFANQWQPAMERLHSVYPYRIEQARWHGFGIALFSKLPIEKETVLQLAKRRTDNPFVVATVKIGDKPLRIAGAHLLSPMDPNRLDIRNQQIEEMGDFLSTDSIPTVVVGDFNCVPWSAFLSDFLDQTGYRDSRQGFGYDGTWYAKKKLLRIPIDHAFVSPSVCVHSRTVGEAAGSDHFPVIVELSVK